MDYSAQTLREIKRALRKVATRFPASKERTRFTDILIQVKQGSGELLAFDNGFTELARCVVEEWINDTSAAFYGSIRPVLRKALSDLRDTWAGLAVVKPYTFVLIGEDKETIAELYHVHDEQPSIGSNLMEGMGKELDDFLDRLMRE